MKHTTIRITAIGLAALLAVLAIPYGLQAAEYRLGTGDVLGILVTGFDNLSADVKVQPDGNISLALIGVVPAVGKTVVELKKELEARYAEYIVNPSISVVIRDFRQDSCIVLGQVANPGRTPVGADATVRGVLALAGGVLGKADLSKISITRNTTTLIVDMSAADQDLPVQPGDVIMIPETLLGVLVLGSVSKPGNWDWTEGMRVIDAVNAAGGLLNDADGASAVLTTKGGKQVSVNIAALVEEGATEHNLVLSRGDVLYIPKQKRRYYVLGEVGKPGEFPMKGDERLVEVLSTAGGATKDADLGAIGVVRVVNGKPEVVQANLIKFAKLADQSQNVEINASDVVFVPAKKRKWTWQDIGAPLSLLNLVLSLRD